MIQFYINNRPVPRAIAADHFQRSYLGASLAEVRAYFNNVAKDLKHPARRLLADHGVNVANI